MPQTLTHQIVAKVLIKSVKSLSNSFCIYPQVENVLRMLEKKKRGSIHWIFYSPSQSTPTPWKIALPSLQHLSHHLQTRSIRYSGEPVHS